MTWLDASRATRRLTACLLVTLLAATGMVFAAAPQVLAANPQDPPGATLEVTPEITTVTKGTDVRFTATLSQGPAIGFQTTIAFEIEDSAAPPAGIPADGVTPQTPDLKCVIEATPQTPTPKTCTTTPLSATAPGTIKVRAWVDGDGQDSTVEADMAEGRYSGTTDCPNNTDCSNGEVPAPGNTSGTPPFEPDKTDVVQISWVNPLALDCTPEQQVAPFNGSGSTVNVTCSYAANVDIAAENLGGANDPDGSAFTSGSTNTTADYRNRDQGQLSPKCRTGSNGQCTMSISAGQGQIGTANICFWADNESGDGNDAYNSAGIEEDGGLCDTETPGTVDVNKTDVVTVTWEARRASGLDLQPESASRQTGTDQVVTAKVYDQFGAEFVAYSDVDLEFFSGSASDSDGNTPASADKTCQTQNASTCTFTINSSTAGTDLVCGWLRRTPPVMSGDVSNGTCDGEALNDPTNEDTVPAPANDDLDVTKITWSAGPTPTPTPSPSGSPTPTPAPTPANRPYYPAIHRGNAIYERQNNAPGEAPANGFIYGNPGDKVVFGDWNGDGVKTPAVVRGGTWYIRNSNSSGNADMFLNYGGPDDVPIAGDWDGDGFDTVGVVRGNTWYLTNRKVGSTNGIAEITFTVGNPGDIPVACDWGSNGFDTWGVVRGTQWFLSYRKNNDGRGIADRNFFFGNPGDIPVAGDWNADGRCSPAVYRNSQWFLNDNQSGDGARQPFIFGNPDDRGAFSWSG